MNPEPVYVRHFSLIDQVEMSGTYGICAAVGAFILVILGIVFFFKRPGTPVRSAYLIACFFPCLFGVLGFATSFMRAFATLGGSGIADGMKLMAALGEVCLPMSFGFTGSGLSLICAALVWSRGK